jgi:hypothetical protein
MSTNNNSQSGPPPFDMADASGTIFRQLGKGLLIASVVFFGPVLFIWVLSLIGDLLPPESKEAADPTPDSFPIIMEMEAEEESSDG